MSKDHHHVLYAYDYAQLYNKNVALLDDPNELKSRTFDAYIYMQNNKISPLCSEAFDSAESDRHIGIDRQIEIDRRIEIDRHIGIDRRIEIDRHIEIDRQIAISR